MALTDSLISYWSLNEASGNAADAHGSNTLTDNNTAGVGTGIISNGRDFDAASSESLSITDASQSGLDFGNEDFSLSFWIKPGSSYGTSGGFVEKLGTAGARDGYSTYVFNDFGTPKFGFMVGVSGGSFSAFNVTKTFSIGTWYHVVCIHDSVANQLSIIFNDGTPSTTSYSGGCAGNTASFHIGYNNYVSGSSVYFDGIIDEVGVWGKVLSGAEITELYNSGSGLAYPFTSTPITTSPAAVAADLTIPAPTLQKIRSTTAVAIDATVTAPTLQKSLGQTPVAVDATIPAPTTAKIVRPDAVSVAVTIADLNKLTQPNAVALDATIPTPAPKKSYSQTTVSLTATIPAVTTVKTVKPAPVAADMTISAPGTLKTVTPAPVQADFTIPATAHSKAVRPDTVSASATVLESTTKKTVTVDPVTADLTIPAPAAVKVQSTVEVAATIPGVSLLKRLGQSPLTLEVTIPAVSASMTTRLMLKRSKLRGATSARYTLRAGRNP